VDGREKTKVINPENPEPRRQKPAGETAQGGGENSFRPKCQNRKTEEEKGEALKVPSPANRLNAKGSWAITRKRCVGGEKPGKGGNKRTVRGGR